MSPLDGTTDSAAEAIAKIPEAEAYADATPAPAQNRDPGGKFAAAEPKAPSETAPKADDAAADQSDDDEDYLEFEQEASDGKGKELIRHKVSEVWDGFQKSKTLEAELAKAHKPMTLPEEIEAELGRLLEAKSSYQRAIEEFAQWRQPQPPHRDLINPESDRYNPERFHQELLAFDRARAEQAKAREEAERVGKETREHQNALLRSRIAREQAKIVEAWPELKDQTKAKAIVESIKSTYNLDDKTLESITDHRFFLLAKDALAHRASEAAKKEAVRHVLAKPKLVRANARSSTHGKDAAINTGFGKLQKSGSLDDAAAVIAAIR